MEAKAAALAASSFSRILNLDLLMHPPPPLFPPLCGVAQTTPNR